MKIVVGIDLYMARRVSLKSDFLPKMIHKGWVLMFDEAAGR